MVIVLVITRGGKMNRKENEHNGNIEGIRAIEDCIRATKKYTEGMGTLRKKHPIQGEDFPSKVFCKYYEVYPDIELSWDMPYGIALDWLWGETPCLDVTFRYDYRQNKAAVTIKDGVGAVKHLATAIPGFSEALAKVIAGGERKIKIS
tara:strand:+ start:11281 stop:11724 length:444 start_codon:yes stop_codon:yes gene_type:complete